MRLSNNSWNNISARDAFPFVVFGVLATIDSIIKKNLPYSILANGSEH